MNIKNEVDIIRKENLKLNKKDTKLVFETLMKVYKSKIVNEARNIMGYTLDVVVANMNGFNRLGNSQNIYQKWGDNFYIDFYNSVFCKEEVDENGDLVSNKSEAFSEINELDSIKNISFSLKEIILICKQNNIDIKLHTKDDYSTMTTLEIKPYEGHIQDDTNIDNYLMSVIDN